MRHYNNIVRDPREEEQEPPKMHFIPTSPLPVIVYCGLCVAFGRPAAPRTEPDLPAQIFDCLVREVSEWFGSRISNKAY